MKPLSRHPYLMRLLGASAIFSSMILTSCDSTKGSNSEAEDLKNQIEEFNAEADRQSAEYIEIIDGLEEKNRDLLNETQDLKALLGTTQKELQALNAEFDDYQDQAAEAVELYISRIQKNGVGDRLDTLIVDGQTLSNIEIVAINLREIRARHESGVIALTRETAPQQWAEKYLFEKPLSTRPKKTPSIVMEEDPEPAASETEPEEGEEKTEAEAAFDPKKAIVVIEGDAGSGTGFFVNSSGSVYLYTAAHVLSGNKSLTIKTIDGREYKRFADIEIAHGVDMARMRVLDRVPFALSPPKPGVIKNEVEIHAMGNSGGGSVITESEGKVQAIGAESFEISAEVIQGNSGGPILQTGTTTVLGLVSHGIQGRSDVWASGTRYTNIRKFGARMDRPIKWTKMPLTTFLAEIDKVEEFQRVTRLLYALSALEPGPNGLRLTTFVNGRFTAQQILAENHSMTAVQNLMKMNIELAEKRIKPDPSASKKRFADYYRGIISGSTRQITAIENLSPYHRDLAKESMAGRTEAHAALVKRLDSLTQ